MRPWQKDPKTMTREEILDEIAAMADQQKVGRVTKAKQTVDEKDRTKSREFLAALKGLPKEEQLKTLELLPDIDTPELRKELGLEG